MDLATKGQPAYKREVPDKGDYSWQMGASLAAESLATGRELLIRPEHSLHIVEIIQAARESQDTGQRIRLQSTFPWPIVS